jgi:NADH:ubiquinone oxidoreductase subunit 6 (subunit J)
MSFEFADDQKLPNKVSRPKRVSFFAQMLIAHSFGQITTEKQANILLFFASGVLILVSLSVLVFGSAQSTHFNPLIDPATGDFLPGEI